VTLADGVVLGVTKVVDSGPSSLRYNLAILGDGYQYTEMGQYANDTQTVINTLFVTPPFDSLRLLINVYRIDIASTDSGADDPVACGGSGATARTYFDARFALLGAYNALSSSMIPPS
jgi:hypothetical protein